MVRLSKDAASRPPDGDRLRSSFARVREGLERITRVRLAPAAQAVANTAAALYAAEREEEWDRQYPVYRCPYQVPDRDTIKRCMHTWDRRKISTPELRMQVWDHYLTDHVSGEAGLLIAGLATERILEGPRG